MEARKRSHRRFISRIALELILSSIRVGVELTADLVEYLIELA